MPPRTRSTGPVKKTTPNVYIWIPNLIGYLRVILTLTSVYYAFSNWVVFIVCYSGGAILDLFDGMAARKFNQCSKFGAVLDMVTDRVSTNLLYLVLAVMNPEYYFTFALLAAADYSSHWAQMYAAAAAGTHHKVLDADRNWLLRVYYSNRVFMFLNCVSQEAFLIALYGWHHTQAGECVIAGQVMYWTMAVSFPMGALKQLINVVQLVDACKQIVKVDLKDLDNKRM